MVIVILPSFCFLKNIKSTECLLLYLGMFVIKEMHSKHKSRWKNAQIEMEILGKFILIDYIDIKDVRTYTKKTPHYNI